MPIDPPCAARRPARAWLLLSAACLLCAGAALCLLKTLPYSSCLVMNMPGPPLAFSSRIEDAPGNFPLDLGGYRAAHSLQAFRNLFVTYCAGTQGLAAATCVNDLFADRFAFGAARQDFCDRRYDPAAALARHMQGSPGHCMQRSGLLAATLLSAGLPARVIQFMYKNDGGHTLLEVYEAGRGWLLFDPSTGSLIGTREGPASAAALLRYPGALQVWPRGKSALQEAVPGSLYKGITGSLLQGHIVYPEPWLYLRTGKRHSFWPFRGAYTVAGTPTWRFGQGQRACQMAALSFGLLALLSAGNAWRVGHLAGQPRRLARRRVAENHYALRPAMPEGGLEDA